MDPKREFLRHAVATIAYRGGKTIRDAPESFAGFEGGGKTPLQILAHIGDLFEWSLKMARGSKEWKDSVTGSWQDEAARFYAALEAFDSYLASEAAMGAPMEKIFQGPIADALTHVGQLAMLRRMSGNPIRGENYYVADIQTGRVGAEQAKAVRGFE
jgi:hypothetical protein